MAVEDLRVKLEPGTSRGIVPKAIEADLITLSSTLKARKHGRRHHPLRGTLGFVSYAGGKQRTFWVSSPDIFGLLLSQLGRDPYCQWLSLQSFTAEQSTLLVSIYYVSITGLCFIKRQGASGHPAITKRTSRQEKTLNSC